MKTITTISLSVIGTLAVGIFLIGSLVLYGAMHSQIRDLEDENDLLISALESDRKRLEAIGKRLLQQSDSAPGSPTDWNGDG